MKIIRFLQILILAVGFLVTACHNDEPLPPQDTTAPRAVLVYMVANNSLNVNASGDMTEMLQAAQAGDFGNSRLLIYQHRRNSNPKLIEVTKEGFVDLKEYDTSVSSVESARMLEAVADFKAAAPARNYGVILWSHGSGWLQNGIQEDLPLLDSPSLPESRLDVSSTEPLSFGQDGTKWMNITTLAYTLEQCGFDYVYFDCCYMAGIEVVYQMRRCAPTIVASATELRADGMPYHLNLKYLLAENPDLNAAAKSTFDYYDAQSGSNRTCTISVVSTAGIDRLAAITREVYARHTPLPDDFKPQQFMTKNCYLFDFKQYVEAICDDPELFRNWCDAFNEVVVYEADTPMLWNELSLANHSGLSTYILHSISDSQYRNYHQLAWWNDVASALF